MGEGEGLNSLTYPWFFPWFTFLAPTEPFLAWPIIIAFQILLFDGNSGNNMDILVLWCRVRPTEYDQLTLHSCGILFAFCESTRLLKLRKLVSQSIRDRTSSQKYSQRMYCSIWKPNECVGSLFYRQHIWNFWSSIVERRKVKICSRDDSKIIIDY